MLTSDVSVVLLSIGEPTTARARASVARQSIDVSDVVDVQDIRPFHRALNEGARRVTTEFFAQVDADMVLDARCLESLRLAMLRDPAIGVAIGFLRDPLVGRVSGIRLFRRACFDDAEFRDSISPDTDFLETINARGWRDVYVLGFDRPTVSELHTFGEHLPDYQVPYVWRKHQMEGARYVYRGLAWGLEWHLGVLETSAHPVAPLARVAMLQGALSGVIDDQLGRDVSDASLRDWQSFRSTTGHAPSLLLRVVSALVLEPVAAYSVCHAVGRTLRQRNAWPTFDRAISLISRSGAPHAWVAQAGLCRGIMPQGDMLRAEDEQMLRRLLVDAPTPIIPRVAAMSRAFTLLRARPDATDRTMD